MDEELDLSTEEVSTEVEAPSMEDTIQKTLDEINSRETSSRDETGRFTPKTPEPEPEKPEEVTQTQVVEPVVETVPPELQRLGLRKEAALKIAKDPEIMAEFMRRSEEMHRGLDGYREKAQFGDNMQKAIEPYMSTIQAAGVTPDVAIKALFNADAMLRQGSPEQKVQMLHQLARDYGIDMQKAAQTPAQSFNPAEFQLRQELEEMRRWREEQTQTLQQQEQQALNSEIVRFASQPDKVFFEDVRDYMASLLQAGVAADLNDAYDKACFANPTVRAKVLAQQQEKADAERKAQLSQKAQAARQAASVNVSRKGTLASAKPVGSMDDTIRETARELGLI